MPSSRTPAESRRTAVTQPPPRPCARSSSGDAGSSTGSKRRCSQLIRARVPGRGEREDRRRRRRARRAPRRGARSRRRARRQGRVAVAPGGDQLGPGAGDPRTGHVRPGREREAERAAGEPGERERLGQHVRQADHPGDGGVLLGGGRRHRLGAEVADECGQRAARRRARCPCSRVSAHGASRNSSGSAADQPVSSTPASGWPPTNVAPGSSRARASSTGASACRRR